MSEQVVVSVPGSIGNLGSGFDCAGLSIAMRNQFIFTAAPADYIEAPAGIAADSRTNVCLRAFRAACTAAHIHPPPVHLRIDARIPPGRGLGSSATAVLAGAIAGCVFAGRTPDPRELLSAGGHFEGSMDNLAASLFGGFVLVSDGPAGPCWRCIRVRKSLRAVFFISDDPFPTPASRRILPARVSLRDAAANAAMVGFLVIAFACSEWDDLRIGMEDRLHQPKRSSLYPHFLPLKEAALAAGAAGCCISGAGPSVVALATQAVAPIVAVSWRSVCSTRGFRGQVRQIPLGTGTTWRIGRGPCMSLL